MASSLAACSASTVNEGEGTTVGKLDQVDEGEGASICEADGAVSKLVGAGASNLDERSKGRASEPAISWAQRATVCAVVVGRLVFAAGASMIMKMQFGQESVGLTGMKEFRKPIFMSITTQLAMISVGLVATLFHKLFRSSAPVAKVQVAPPADSGAKVVAPTSYKKKVILVAIPSVLALASTLMNNVSLMLMSASVNQMFKVSSIVAAAMLQRVCLSKRVKWIQWLGVCTCCTGILIGGVSQLYGAELGDAKTTGLAMMLALVSQCLNGAEGIAEEVVIKKFNMPALQTIGWEGFWGLIMVLLFVQVPAYFSSGSDNGRLEDLVDSLVMCSNSPALVLGQLAYAVVFAASTSFGILLTVVLSSVHKKMVNCGAGVVIWIFALCVFYLFDKQARYAESWSSDRSFLQLAGFALIYLGLAIYSDLIVAPSWLSCFKTHPTAPDEASSASSFDQAQHCESGESAAKQEHCQEEPTWNP